MTRQGKIVEPLAPIGKFCSAPALKLQMFMRKEFHPLDLDVHIDVKRRRYTHRVNIEKKFQTVNPKDVKKTM